MFGRWGKRGERREPVFDFKPEAELDLRLTENDRPSGRSGRGRDAPQRRDKGDTERRAPRVDERRPLRFEPLPDDDASYDEEFDMAPARGRKSSRGKSRSSSTARRTTGRKRKRSFIGRIFRFGMTVAVLGGIALAGLLVYEIGKLPPIHELAVPKRPPSMTMIAPNTMVLATRGETAGFVGIEEMPPDLPNAVIAIEDRRFRSHWGFDPKGILRAAVENFRAGGFVQGGSTLTQQLAKNIFLTPDRSLERKFQELILAGWLEMSFTKDEILEMYLNRVYFGAGAHGVEAAARRFFGKSARNVSLAEAAILAGLVQAPSRLAPTKNPDAANARAKLVLAAMADAGFITQQEAQQAFAAPSAVTPPPPQDSTGYVADWVASEVDRLIGPYENDIFVDVTVDPTMQKFAEQALVEGLEKRGKELGVSQGALVALSPDGAVQALVGGRSYAESSFNRAIQARRQPGSSFKPFVYLAALETGLTPFDVRLDAPVRYGNWSPENSNKKYHGNVTLTQALAFSLNTVAVRLAVEVGPQNVANLAAELGIHSKLTPNASLALGTSEVTPLEMATAYTPFANGGARVEPYVVTRITDAEGKVIYERQAPPRVDVIAPEYVGMMNSMLRETLRVGTASKAELPGWDAAGKTGTSQDYRDAWFVGYTTNMVTAVWLGNDDNSPTKRASGSNLPVTVWSSFMQRALEGVPVAQLPGEWNPRSYDPPVQQAPVAEAPAIIQKPVNFLKRLFGG
ncbi:transglycosylase domain-containing protein [Agaricicola taiwanensis]|nr:penicillin-binding protein 1A [Agaricicola taiwanensis]